MGAQQLFKQNIRLVKTNALRLVTKLKVSTLIYTSISSVKRYRKIGFISAVFLLLKCGFTRPSYDENTKISFVNFD